MLAVFIYLNLEDRVEASGVLELRGCVVLVRPPSASHGCFIGFWKFQGEIFNSSST